MADYWMEQESFQLQGVPDNVKLSQLNNLLYEALTSTGNVSQCALVTRKGLEVQAHSDGFKLNTKNLNHVIGGFRNTAAVRKEGINFEGVKYKCIRADKYSIYASTLYEDVPRGLVAVRTNTYVLLAKYTHPMYPAVCIEATEKLAEYLRAKGR